MLNNFSNTVGLPVLRIDMSEEAVREQLHEMHNYLWQLQEWLDWKLRHLEVEDFTEDALARLIPTEKAKTESVKVLKPAFTGDAKVFNVKLPRLNNIFLMACGYTSTYICGLVTTQDTGAVGFTQLAVSGGQTCSVTRSGEIVTLTFGIIPYAQPRLLQIGGTQTV